MNFADIDHLLGSKKVSLAICMPEEIDSITAAYEASKLGFVNCIFVGNIEVMQQFIDKCAPGFTPEMINAETPEEAAFKTVELVRTGKAKALMKGNISTPILLKAVLNSETGIKDSSVLSHVLVYEHEGSLKFLTDGGMIPAPTLDNKIEIIKNAYKIAKKFGCNPVKVGVLSAAELVNTKIQSSLDAAVLSKMSEQGYFGDDCIVDGPFGLDNVISEEAAKIKKVKKNFEGNADILVCSDIDSGNILGKSILYYGNTRAGGMIIGAKCPVILLSRADTKEIRLDSIKLALAAGHN
ncbi:MAG: phosphate butyryltransferase [Candidatus Riflebacteria bacterium]|nr:phosphate butyryltransferase [Candidatus Riflebacteria bacterium]